MSIFDWFEGRFRRVYESLDDGWVQADAPLASVYGSHYVQLRLTDFAIADARNRLRERKAVFQSVVTVVFGNDTIPVPSTVGPDSMAPLGGDGFLRLAHRNVALTGWLPFNSANIEVLGGLVSAPGTSDIDIATGFLGKLSDLVKVPQLSTAVTLATTVANGAASLLGGDSAEGLIGLQLGLGLGDVRDGFYLAIEPQGGQRPALETLGVVDSRLVDYGSTNHTGQPGLMDGWNYLLLEVRTTETIGDAWREMSQLRDPLRAALERLGSASSAKQAADARSMLNAATLVAAFCPDLTAADRKRVIAAMESEWNEAAERRKARRLDAGSSTSRSAASVDTSDMLNDAFDVGADIQQRLAMVNDAI